MAIQISNPAGTVWFYCCDSSGNDYLATTQARAKLFNSHDAAHSMRESRRFSHLLEELIDRVGDALRVSIAPAEWKAA